MRLSFCSNELFYASQTSYSWATGVAAVIDTFANRMRTITAFPNEVHTTVPSVVVAPFARLNALNPMKFAAVVPVVVAWNKYPFSSMYDAGLNPAVTTVEVPGYTG